MTIVRKVEAYFKNENDAESAKASLQSIKTTSVFIEEMSAGTDTKLYVPFFTTNVEAAGAPSNVRPLGAQVPFLSEENHGEITHLLHFDVSEEEHDQAISILKDHDCFTLKS